MHAQRSTAAALLLTLALPAAPLTPNRSVSLQSSQALARDGSPAFALATSTWLEGELEAMARLTLRSAEEPKVRGAAGGLWPAVGLRWAPDAGRWRPTAELELEVRLPLYGRAVTPGGVVRLGAEWLPARDLGLCGGLGLRWSPGRPLAAEGALEARLYF
jgi:hypothetical protein